MCKALGFKIMVFLSRIAVTVGIWLPIYLVVHLDNFRAGSLLHPTPRRKIKGDLISSNN